MDDIQTNSTDEAIRKCEALISSHSRSANKLLTLIMLITAFFLMAVIYPIIVNSSNISLFFPVDFNNAFINKINSIDSITNDQYDSLIQKAILYQNLLNAKEQSAKAFYDSNPNFNNTSLNDYILYGVFILVLGVIASFYRFHLKEIARQEHYLIGFQRIKIAAYNSSTKYDDEVKKSLTKDAFLFERPVTSKARVSNPLEGHPTSDIIVEMLNKILDKVDLVKKEDKR